MSYYEQQDKVQGYEIPDTYSSYSYSSSSYSSDSEPWISHFCGLRSNEYLVQVDLEFIKDGFNLYGLSNQVENYNEALDLILDENYCSCSDSDESMVQVEMDAQLLYGLIHARYILTGDGLDDMYEKYRDGVYGTCPRVSCQKQHLLPIGESNIPGTMTVKVFCPCCKEIYYPANNAVACMMNQCP